MVLMICSKTQLDSEVDTIKRPVIDNGYLEDILLSSIKEKVANNSSEKQLGTESVRFTLTCPGFEMSPKL